LYPPSRTKRIKKTRTHASCGVYVLTAVKFFIQVIDKAVISRVLPDGIIPVWLPTLAERRDRFEQLLTEWNLSERCDDECVQRDPSKRGFYDECAERSSFMSNREISGTMEMIAGRSKESNEQVMKNDILSVLTPASRVESDTIFAGGIRQGVRMTQYVDQEFWPIK
jgi:hypothetical protein